MLLTFVSATFAEEIKFAVTTDSDVILFILIATGMLNGDDGRR